MPTSPRTRAQGPPDKKKWTLLMYMAASHDHKLEAAAIRDLRELERVPGDDKVNVLVFVDRAWPGSQVYRIDGRGCHQIAIPSKGDTEGKEIQQDKRKPSTLTIKSGTGLKETLKRFLLASLDEAPAEHYALVLWGHAYGLGFGREHKDPLTIAELRRALASFKKRRAEDGRSKPVLEVLAANACAMSYAEAAYELKDVVEYLAASQITVPFAGFPYDVILRGMRREPDARELGCLIVDAFTSSFAASSSRSRVAMTLLDLKEAHRLAPLLHNLAEAIHRHVSPAGTFEPRQLAAMRDIFFGAATGDVRPLLDVKQLCDDFASLRSTGADARGSSISALVQAADQFGKFIERPKHQPSADARETAPALAADAGLYGDVPKAGHPRDKGNHTRGFRSTAAPPVRGGGEFVVRYNGAPDLDNLHGLGIFAPLVTSDDQLQRLGLAEVPQRAAASRRIVETSRRTYELLRIFQRHETSRGADGLWPKLVYDVLRQDVPDSASDCVESCGASHPAQRSDVAQLVVQLHSVFNKFDRAVTLCRERWELGEWRDSEPMNRSELAAKLQALELCESAIATQPAKPLSVRGLDEIVCSLRWAENALASLEKTLRRILTNESYGLGPPKGTGDMGPSTGLGVKDPKGTGMGLDINDPKGTGMGFDINDPKGTGMGASVSSGSSIGGLESGPVSLRGLRSSLAAVLATASSSDHAGAGAVASLFGLVAESLRRLEIALEDVETVLVVHAIDDVARPVSRTRVNRAFRLLDEASRSARRIIVQVMNHPLYGLGPGAAGIGPEVRHELAMAGGFSAAFLKLL